MRFRLHLSALALAAAMTVPLGMGCDDTADGQGVNGASTRPATGQDEHDDHEGEEHAEEGEGEEHADEVRLTAEAVRQYGIVVGQPERRPLAQTVVAPARVGFDEERMAHVGSLVDGRVSEIRAKLGDRVEQDDVLLVIDSPELGRLQSEFLAARSSAEAAKPAVTLARQSYERAQQLYDETEGGISLTEVQRRQADLAAAEREQISADAALTAARNALRLHGMADGAIEQLAASGEIDPAYEVRAPIAGQVVEREVTPGELVGPDDERLLVLADLSTVWVLADVAEAKLATLGAGSPASLEVPAMPGRTFEGTVTYVSPLVSEGTRTARLRVEVPNPDGLLRPGMFARAALGPTPTTGGEPVLSLPAEAVMTVEGEPSVFIPVEGEPNTFARRAVVVGPRVGGFVPILSGIEEGQPVVIAGTFILKAEIGKAGAAHEH